MARSEAGEQCLERMFATLTKSHFYQTFRCDWLDCDYGYQDCWRGTGYKENINITNDQNKLMPDQGLERPIFCSDI